MLIKTKNKFCEKTSGFIVSELGVWFDEENIVRVLWENQSHFHTNQVVKVFRASAAIL